LYVPAKHGWQVEPLKYVPTEHDIQLVEEVAPSTEVVPGGHVVHAVCPVLSLYVPAKHGVHEL
jgi:hypothetical protein